MGYKNPDIAISSYRIPNAPGFSRRRVSNSKKQDVLNVNTENVVEYVPPHESMKQNHVYSHSAVMQSYAYNDQRTKLHDEMLSNMGFELIHSDEKNVVYKNSNGNIQWGIAGSESYSDYYTGAKLFISSKPSDDFQKYSKNIEETIYKQLREENPEGRIFVSAHSSGGYWQKRYCKNILMIITYVLE